MIELMKIEPSNRSSMEWIFNFMHENTVEDDTITLPGTVEDLDKPGLYFYIAAGFADPSKIGIVSFQHVTPWLADLQRTLVHVNHRGKGYGREISEAIEAEIKKLGYGKIMMACYSTNKAIIGLKMSEGYLIEGCLRDHYSKGKHDYIFGKML